MARNEVEKRPSKARVWVLATRPNTLALSFTPVLIGASLVAKKVGHVEAGPSVQFWIFAALIQIGTNLHNDYSDFVKGADTEKRVGQARATQKGWLTANETLGGAMTALAAAAAVGANLAARPGCARAMGFVVATSLFNAVAYTGGFPLTAVGLHVSLGYSGLGDVFVLAYFGYVATIAPYYLQVPSYPPLPLLLAATALGFLATGVMVVNNLRDRLTDVSAGKRTTAVRFGERFARAEYVFLVLGAYAVVITAVALGQVPATWLSSLASAPLAVRLLRSSDAMVHAPSLAQRIQLRAVLAKDGAALNPHVGGTAKSVLFLVYHARFVVVRALSRRLQLVFGICLFLGVALAPAASSSVSS